MGHYACDMRPDWFEKPDPLSPKQEARKIVDDWMGKRDVVLKTRAYNDLVSRIERAFEAREPA